MCGTLELLSFRCVVSVLALWCYPFFGCSVGLSATEIAKRDLLLNDSHFGTLQTTFSLFIHRSCARIFGILVLSLSRVRRDDFWHSGIIPFFGCIGSSFWHFGIVPYRSRFVTFGRTQSRENAVVKSCRGNCVFPIRNEVVFAVFVASEMDAYCARQKLKILCFSHMGFWELI